MFDPARNKDQDLEIRVGTLFRLCLLPSATVPSTTSLAKNWSLSANFALFSRSASFLALVLLCFRRIVRLARFFLPFTAPNSSLP